MDLKSYMLLCIFAQVCAAGGAEAKAASEGREWSLSPECRIDGSILTVTVPKDKAGGMHAAKTTVDFALFEDKGFEATVRVRGKDVSVPPMPYNGVKVMFHYRDKLDGSGQWPGAKLPTGSFDWCVASVRHEAFSGAEGGTAELSLGLQDSSGEVSFDLSTLTIGAPRPHWPITNLDHVAVYTPDVATRPRMRGVMSPARDMNEDDFKTLKSWGATLLRYQMVRDWHGVNTNQDVDEFDHWLNGKLDNFDNVVLPMAEKCGLKVVLDFHVPPGGRDASGDMNMFYDEKYANHFIETWRRIARRFKGREGLYGYDLINEPAQSRPAKSGMDYWSLQRRAAEAVRSEDPHTPIVIESNCWDSPTTFAYLSPIKLTNIIYQVHIYAPMNFTHQRVLNTRKWTVGYPNAEKGWNAAYMRDVMKPVREFQLKHNARIYVGEFSAVAWAPGAEKYLEDCIALFEEYGWDWSYHAFREWDGWSVEHEGPDAQHLAPSADNPRKRALLKALRRDAERPLKAVSPSDAELNDSAAMNATEASAATGDKGGVRIVFIGNSITLHNPHPAIGWTNMWGMAASAEDKDYVHLVTKGIEKNTGRRADVRVKSLYAFERNYRTWDVASGVKELVDFDPEYLIVALGENVPNLDGSDDREAYRAAFGKLAGAFFKEGHRPKTVIRGVFWPNAAKDAEMARVADGLGIPFVKADIAETPGMKATGLFWHNGVANHPGDAGMAEIANRVLDALFGRPRPPDAQR